MIQLHWVSDQGGNPNRLSDTDANLRLFYSKEKGDELENLFAEIVNQDRLVFLSTFLDDLVEFIAIGRKQTMTRIEANSNNAMKSP
jgi:hypothetical protein